MNANQQIDSLKSKGQYREAGILAAANGKGRSYGCHFGMRSGLNAAKEAYEAGFDHAEAQERIAIKDTEAYEGPAVQYTNEDGYPAAVIMPVVVAIAVDGRMFQLLNSLKVDWDDEGWAKVATFGFNLTKAHDIAGKALERGYIRAEYWTEVTEDEMRDYNRGSYHA